MSLYRIYRPKTFAELAGQEAIKQTLENEIASGKIVHAYLFAGPRAVGKTSTARIFVRAINCQKRKEGESEPCNECESCIAIRDGRTLDVLEIDAASHTGVDHVRETIIGAARVANTSLKYKAFIIDEVHMLSTPAFNALLKVMEEPPAHVVFILATTELHKVPPTIVSRCQRFDFKKIPARSMEARLKMLAKAEKKEIDDDVIANVIRLTDGYQRDAESLLGQLLSLGGKRITADLAKIVLPRSNQELVRELIELIAEKRSGDGLSIVDRLLEEGVDLGAFTNDTIEYLRMILLTQNGGESLLSVTARELEAVLAVSKKMNSERVLSLIDFFVASQAQSRLVSIRQLPLEVAIVKSCLV